MQLAWIKILEIVGIILPSNQLLTANQVFHPAIIVKKGPSSSIHSEEAYISFVGCETNNRSIIDELPTTRKFSSDLRGKIGEFNTLRTHLSELRDQFGDFSTLRNQLSEMLILKSNLNIDYMEFKENVEKFGCMFERHLRISHFEYFL